jgi:3-oxoacyl-[acyl-carrier-protein] synthase II
LREVVVTGVGVILPGCDERQTLWSQLAGGESQLRFDAFAPTDAPRMTGRLGDFEAARYLSGIDTRYFRNCTREQQIYFSSVAQAARDAGFGLDDLRGAPFGLFDGSSRSCFAHWYELFERRAAAGSGRLTQRDLSPTTPAQTVGIAAALFGLTGPSMAFNATCASGAVAIGTAFQQLQTGRLELAFATGHDAALVEPLFEMYQDANLLSSESSDPARAIAPFTGHHGNAFGEGAVTLVLETRDSALARGANMLAEVTAYRHENGGTHPTDVDFAGEHPARVIQLALEDAFATADDIDFVIGHGNGVRASDISELNYMKRVFGARARQVPLLSTKPIYGHTLGASSALNVAAAALMLSGDYLIPTLGVDERRVVHGFNHQSAGHVKSLRAGLAVSYGLGGQNAVIGLGKVHS